MFLFKGVEVIMSQAIKIVSFLSEITDRQLSAKEFFTNSLLSSIERNFGLNKARIFYYTLDNQFLSVKGENSLILSNENDDLKNAVECSSIRKLIYDDAVRDGLTYFDIEPRLYVSSQVIKDNYDQSSYVKMLEKNYQAHYTVTMAFGMNAYIEVMFCRTKEEGDFTQEEIEFLEDLYVFIANSYKTYKKHEQSKIISSIQSRVIELGEKAFIVTDDFLHILSYNDQALSYLKEILGESIESQMEYGKKNHWLHLILGTDFDEHDHALPKTRMVKDYQFKIQIHDQHYSNKIIDRYYWITINRNENEKQNDYTKLPVKLTKTEQKVAQLMYEGLTYNEIAEELVVSYHTIKKHVQNIYAKCEVTRRHELYRFLDKKEG